MENEFVVIGIVLVVLILAVVFFLATTRYKQVDSEINTHLVKGKFKGSNKEETPVSGKVDVSGIKGKNVAIGDVVGAKGSGLSSGKVKVSNVTAQKDVHIGDVIGTENKDG